MPYIKKDQRQKFDENIEKILLSLSEGDDAKGELIYVMFTLIIRHLAKIGMSYSNVNDYVGVFGRCQYEFFRRVISKLEDEQILKNGDIETLWSI